MPKKGRKKFFASNDLIRREMQKKIFSRARAGARENDQKFISNNLARPEFLRKVPGICDCVIWQCDRDLIWNHIFPSDRDLIGHHEKMVIAPSLEIQYITFIQAFLTYPKVR